MKCLKILLFILMIWSFCLVGNAAEIKDIRLAANTENTVRFVAELSKEVLPVVSHLKNPTRLVIDFPKIDFSSSLKKPVPVSFVNAVRTGVPEKGVSRVVLELPENEVSENHFTLKPQSGKDWRFVLDLSLNEKKTSGSKKTENSVSPVKKVQKVIVLDPGHGGQDPGAISRSGYYEKDITLKMAKETKKLLEKEGYKVVMTRDIDVFIPLRGRIKKAHQAKADLFISIHADSAKNKSARGLSVYTISERASDAEAAALAERENRADISTAIDLSDIDPSAGNVLLDLEKTDTMNKSSIYADIVVDEMKKKVQLVPKAHRFAGFVVLKSPSIPSVLLELGYLSNKTEDQNLQKESYRKSLAESLVKAVKVYFTKHADE